MPPVFLALALLLGCPHPAPPASTPAPRYTVRTSEVRSWYLRAAVAREHGDFDESVRALGWVRRLEAPDSPWPAVALGEVLEQAGRLDDARAAYSEAIALHPSLGVAHLALARIALTRDEVVVAEDHLRIAADDQRLSDAYDVWVRLQLREGDGDAAQTLLRWVSAISEPVALAHTQAQLAEQIGCDALPSVDVLWASWPDDQVVSGAATRMHHRCAAQ